MAASTHDAFHAVMVDPHSVALDPHSVALAMGLMVLLLVDFDGVSYSVASSSLPL